MTKPNLGCCLCIFSPVCLPPCLSLDLLLILCVCVCLSGCASRRGRQQHRAASNPKSTHTVDRHSRESDTGRKELLVQRQVLLLLCHPMCLSDVLLLIVPAVASERSSTVFACWQLLERESCRLPVADTWRTGRGRHGISVTESSGCGSYSCILSGCKPYRKSDPTLLSLISLLPPRPFIVSSVCLSACVGEFVCLCLSPSLPVDIWFSLQLNCGPQISLGVFLTPECWKSPET